MASYTKRWIKSGIIELVILAVLVLMPFWKNPAKTTETTFVDPDSEISMVTVQKKVVIPQTVPQPKPKTEPVKRVVEETIPSPAPVEPAEEIEPVQETVPEEVPLETSDYVTDVPVQNTATQKTTASYKSYALSRIASKKSYPIAARTEGLEGKVKLHVIIDKDGNLVVAEILTPCDSDLLNDAALNAVKKSAPFKKMKDGLNIMDLKFTMDFSLTE